MSDLTLKARRLVMNALRQHVYRVKSKEDSKYAAWSFMEELYATSKEDWDKYLEEERPDPTVAEAAIIEALPEAVQEVQHFLDSIGVKGDAVSSFVSAFDVTHLLTREPH